MTATLQNAKSVEFYLDNKCTMQVEDFDVPLDLGEWDPFVGGTASIFAKNPNDNYVVRLKKRDGTPLLYTKDPKVRLEFPDAILPNSVIEIKLVFQPMPRFATPEEEDHWFDELVQQFEGNMRLIPLDRYADLYGRV